MPGPGRSSSIVALTLLSGCCALAYEVLYVRALTTVLGDMLYVHAALLATFLVGIGVGARLAHRAHRVLWLLEIATGAYALVLPVLLAQLSGWRGLSSITAAPGWTIVATITLVAPPSLLIGFSIPLFSAYLKSSSPERLAFRRIYVAYNLGALLSILLVELWLVRVWGIRLSLALIGAVNVFNGLVLLRMRVGSTPRPSVQPRRFSPRVIVALSLASLVSAAYQMFIIQLVYLVFSPHRENFAVALTLTMLGIFLGSWIASRVAVRFEMLMAWVPLCIGAIYAAYRPILELVHLTGPLAERAESLVLLQKLLIGSLFAIGPMILFGATLPALMRDEGDVAEESGHLLFVSSMANATGYLAYVLFLRPALETPALLIVLGLTSMAAGWIAPANLRRRTRILLGAVGVALLALMAVRWHERELFLAQWIHELTARDEVRIFKSGAESATLVRGRDASWISYNGHPSIYVQLDGEIPTSELVSGVLPALSAPSLERALVLGMGTGITGGATATLFDATDVVEINQAFFDMLPEFDTVNFAIRTNPAAALHLADGRAFLVGREGTYDAIVNSIPAPTYYSASKIYTVEFYERVHRALKPGGVFLTWLAVPNMSEQGVLTVLAAMRRSFDHCDLSYIDRFYYMTTCSDRPIRRRRFTELPLQLDLVDHLQKAFWTTDLDRLFDDLWVSPNLFERFDPVVPAQNTDDHAVLEFMTVRHYQIRGPEDDPFLNDSERWNVSVLTPAEIADPETLVRKAVTYYQLGGGFFERDLLPALRADSEAARRFETVTGQALPGP